MFARARKQSTGLANERMSTLARVQASSWELYDAFEAADAAEAEAEEREAAAEKENSAAGAAAQARTEEVAAAKRYSDSVSERVERFELKEGVVGHVPHDVSRRTVDSHCLENLPRVTLFSRPL